MNNSQILLVKFDSLVQKSLYEMLCRSNYKVNLADSVDDALVLLDSNLFHVVLIDINGTDNLDLLRVLKNKAENSEVIVLASYGNLEAAVNSIKLGAFDYLVRPVDDHKIIAAIERAVAEKTPDEAMYPKANRNALLGKFLHKDDRFHDLVGNSRRAKEIYSVIERISNSRATILLKGESGTGKRVIAQAIHKADKKRRNKPFIEISCGALPREIIESELFGHTKGAFTGAINDRKGRFELANGGTILLDDIDSLPLDLQVKLLRVLQQKEFERVGDHKTLKVDVRVIATTNQDIKKAVTEKRFREDLYYRIDVICIDVPPLRERMEDLPLLVNHFINLYAKENHKKIQGIGEDTLKVLIDYNWPRNIRELENIVERAIILDTDNVIEKDDLPEVILAEKTFLPHQAGSNIIKNIATSLKEALHEPEKVHILRVLKEVGWNKKKAATKLGVNRTTLYNKLRKYNIFSHSENGNLK
ncbi:MAG: sigma-54 dependent transcriptional regulator [Candidatus Omnitrophota bacterium]